MLSQSIAQQMEFYYIASAFAEYVRDNIQTLSSIANPLITLFHNNTYFDGNSSISI